MGGNGRVKKLEWLLLYGRRMRERNRRRCRSRLPPCELMNQTCFFAAF